MTTLDLYVADLGEQLSFTARTVVICGYTGRDEAAAQRHIDELAAIGVPRPARIPDLNAFEGSLVTTAEVITASGPRTSGEVEPVLLFTKGTWYLGVGSDHTDRDLETIDMAASKRACDKPIAATVYSASWAEKAGDHLIVESWSEGESDPMQQESIAYFRDRDELISLISDKVGGDLEGVVAFCGTVPLRSSGFVFATGYVVALRNPATGERIAKHYHVTPAGDTDRQVLEGTTVNGGTDAQR